MVRGWSPGMGYLLASHRILQGKALFGHGFWSVPGWVLGQRRGCPPSDARPEAPRQREKSRCSSGFPRFRSVSGMQTLHVADPKPRKPFTATSPGMQEARGHVGIPPRPAAGMRRCHHRVNHCRGTESPGPVKPWQRGMPQPLPAAKGGTLCPEINIICFIIIAGGAAPGGHCY